MGLLENAGSPISWDDKRRPEANKYVMEHGIKQFINMYRKHCATSSLSSNKEFLWGDELEFILVHRPNGDTAQRQNRLSLCGDKILSEINDLPQDSVEGKWLPEYGSFMIECTPKMPYHATAVALAQVQDNMQRRYNFLVAHGRPHDVIPLPMTMYPLMGVGAFTEPGVDSESLPLTNSISRSLFVPDACINAHPRFGTLTKNIRLRRGQKVCIQVPILLDDRTQVDPILNIDVSTMNRWIEDDLLAQRNRVVVAHSAASERTDKRQRDENESEDVAGQQAGCKNVPQNFTEYFFPQYYQNHSGVRKRYESFQQGNAYHHPCVYMDCMAFGMGCCCLQVTMQLQDMSEARHVYDQLAIVSPIFLALTAATAVQKGILTDNDVRWVTVSGSVDDRTDEEVPKIVKSRYDSISTFVGQRVDVTRFNDCNMEINDLYLKELLDAGLDPLLARHIAHLFIREPLVIYDGKLETVDDLTMSDHFENIQSTNWQTVRLKPPPADGYHIGWRVEFRIMEISPSMFENAAYSVFIILLARAILKYNLCMYVPLSVVEMNMAHAHRRDATRERPFHFRENITQRLDAEQIAVRRMLIGEIINGFEVISNGEHNEDTRSDDFKGLAHYVERYVDELEHEDTTKDTSGSDQYKLERANAYARIRKYIAFVRKKASGEIPSVASYIRTLVRSHPTYKNDSRVNDDITKEIIDCVYNMALGKADCPSLIPEQFHFVKK